MRKESDRDNIGGYFSYVDGVNAKCVFYSRQKGPKVIGTISFDRTYNVAAGIADLKERHFTEFENQLYQLREISMKEIASDTSLMLYEKFTGWKTHQVISRKYLNIWNCETNQLTVIPMGTIDKINKDQEKRKRKRDSNR